MTNATRKFLKPRSKKIEIPNLIELQLNSYKWFLTEGLKELFEEISPVTDFTGEKYELSFVDYHFAESKYDEKFALENNLTYKAPLKVKLSLLVKDTGEIREQEIFLGDFPMMTNRGTFVVNGIERVVVNQIIRSFGVLFTSEENKGRTTFGAKIIPSRGAWLEIETNQKDVISVKIDRKRKLPITTFLRAMGYNTDAELKEIFESVDDDPDHNYFKSTIAKDPSKDHESGVIETYHRMRPGEMATYENAKSLFDSMFFDLKRYDLSRVGRYKINQRLNLDIANKPENRILRKEDVAAIIREVVRLNATPGSKADDIDHLGNRRVRSVGELIQGRVRVGLLRMERTIKDRMSIADPISVTPAMLVNARPIVAVLQEFFASSPLSQFMNQTNPLAELEHKRTLAATGPGGIVRDRASFEVRDVHTSHYGRICPIETPEGPNVGLVSYLASYARINEFGFIESPYYRVINSLKISDPKLIDKIVASDILQGKTVIIPAGTKLTKSEIAKAKAAKIEKIKIKSYVSSEIVYLDAGDEQKHVIAPASVKIKDNYFVNSNIIARKAGEPEIVSTDEVEFIDVSPQQIVSVSSALIPFLENTDAARAMMGSNMQKQAVPLVKADSPYIGTGMEYATARDSGQLLLAEKAGKVVEADSNQITIREADGFKRTYRLANFVRTNQMTCFHQIPIVKKGEKVQNGQPIADSMATDKGELALGKNVLAAFMQWRGANYEDAIIISERLAKEHILTSIHIQNYTTEVRETKLGPEVVTRDIPNVGEEALKNLDEDGIVRIGAEVDDSDILVGKITPKGEAELSAEERLLRAIFGEKAKDVRDTSLRLPHGVQGKVVDVKVFSKDKGAELPAGVFQQIEVSVAQLRKISIGDKLSGRHGNKGVIAKVLPVEDMPYLEDGTPVDIILNPLGVVGRMNIGQILETHLALVAQKNEEKYALPTFESARFDEIKNLLEQNGYSPDGKMTVYDGMTGEPLDEKVTVGPLYILKLVHLVDDKAHARSIGPYSMVTQQPLGGKAQFGGQRFGEMEVWALEAYGAAYSLQEMLTIKSDDVIGRSKAYEAILKGEPISRISTPESFNVLVRELQALGLSLDLLKGKQVIKQSKDKEL